MEEVTERAFSSPFEEILPYADAAARNFLMYLERNRGTFSPQDCEQIRGVLLSFDALVPERRSHPDAEALRQLFDLFEGLDPQHPFNLQAIQSNFGGQETRVITMGPFDLIRISSNAAAHRICELLVEKKGNLNLDECHQIRQILSNFEVLATDAPSVDTENIVRLARLIYPDGKAHQDAYEMLVRSYASEHARQEYFSARAAADPDEAPVIVEPVIAARGDLRTRVLTWFGVSNS